MDNHPCTQEKVLATMCEQLKNIEADIKEIKDTQIVFMKNVNALMLDIAKRPTPEDMGKALSKIERHELYFKIIWVLGAVGWGALLFLLDKFWH